MVGRSVERKVLGNFMSMLLSNVYRPLYKGDCDSPAFEKVTGCRRTQSQDFYRSPINVKMEYRIFPNEQMKSCALMMDGKPQANVRPFMTNMQKTMEPWFRN
jgi:hypothetical protein